MKILFIDDDQALSAVMSAALTNAGFTVETAYNGTAGLNKAKSEQYNLILLDQVLPDISGNEILKEVKSNQQLKAIPVLMLSNFSQEELVKEAINLGAADYIYKYQIEPEDLVNKIKQVFADQTTQAQQAPTTN